MEKKTNSHSLLRFSPIAVGPVLVRAGGSEPPGRGFNSCHRNFIRALGRAAKVPGFQPGKAGSIPAGHFEKIRVGSSAAERAPVKRQRAGSSPARPSSGNPKHEIRISKPVSGQSLM